jgi:hypothetical protein
VLLALLVAAHALLIMVGLRIGMGTGIIVYATAMLDFGIYMLVARPPLDVLCSSQVPASDMRILEVFRLFVIFLADVSHRAGHPSRGKRHPIFISCFEKVVSVLAFSTYSRFRNIVVVLSK